jgi:hypothetical protein
MNKSLFYLLFLFGIFQSYAQDSLILKSGELKIVKLISVDKSYGIIIYQIDGQQTIQAISSIQSFTNHSGIGFVNMPFQNTTHRDAETARIEALVRNKFYSSYSYSNYSVGLNLLSSLSPFGKSVSVTIASNFNLSGYFQYNFNQNIGLRFPLRLGFNHLSNKSSQQLLHSYGDNIRDLSFESGIEPVFMFNDQKKINFYLLPGFYFGRNKGVQITYMNGNYTPIYSMGVRHNFYRFAMNTGVQINKSKSFQLNIELGINVNNIRTLYYYPYKPVNTLGIQGAINLVYRFKGRKITN